MQSDKSCKIVEQYLAYLVTIKGRSRNTILEYRLDLLLMTILLKNYLFLATVDVLSHAQFKM
jgi:integrase/recombinase XerD